MAELKTKPTEVPVRDFLEGVADERRRADCYVLVDLMRQATGADATMWGSSIVGFGKYHYRYESGHEGDAAVVGFSPRKNELVLYIMPGFERYADLMAKLGKHRTGKSCLYIKKLEDVDLAVLKILIDESVRAMADRRVDVPGGG